jgi:uncharacterized protein (DUF983 family)
VPTAGRIFVRALLKRCPWCGNPKIFKHWLRIRERCPWCGLRFDREEGAWLVSITINYGVTAIGWIVLFVVTLVVSLPHVDVPLLAATSVAEIVGVTLLVYPFSKTVTAAADLLVHGAHNGLSHETAERFGLE